MVAAWGLVVLAVGVFVGWGWLRQRLHQHLSPARIWRVDVLCAVALAVSVLNLLLALGVPW